MRRRLEKLEKQLDEVEEEPKFKWPLFLETPGRTPSEEEIEAFQEANPGHLIVIVEVPPDAERRHQEMRRQQLNCT